MNGMKNNDLKTRIMEEMTIDYETILERNFDRAKQLLRVTQQGTVSVRSQESLTGRERILLYLVGKLYAKEAGLAATGDAGNEELVAELGMPEGSVLPALKELRDAGRVDQTRRGRFVYHMVPLDLVERTLKEIEGKMSDKLKGGADAIR